MCEGCVALYIYIFFGEFVLETFYIYGCLMQCVSQKCMIFKSRDFNHGARDVSETTSYSS